MYFPAIVVFCILMLYWYADIRKDNPTFVIALILSVGSIQAHQIYNILKYSSPYGGKTSPIILISVDDGRYINDIAKTDFHSAFIIALKYTFIISRDRYLAPNEFQTYRERKAGVYLVKNEKSVK